MVHQITNINSSLLPAEPLLTSRTEYFLKELQTNNARKLWPAPRDHPLALPLAFPDQLPVPQELQLHSRSLGQSVEPWDACQGRSSQDCPLAPDSPTRSSKFFLASRKQPWFPGPSVGWPRERARLEGDGLLKETQSTNLFEKKYESNEEGEGEAVLWVGHW